jgi:glucokinase
VTAARRVLIAVDIGGTTVKGALYPEDGPSLAVVTSPTFPGGDQGGESDDEAVTAVVTVVDQLATVAATEGLTLTGIGVCSPGVVDSESGLVVLAVNLGWTALPLTEILSARFGVPVALDHDARAAARAERVARQDLGRDADDLVFIPIGTGISATVVSGGSVIVGAAGAAGEFGHVPVVPEGERCSCGQRGCVEVYASAGNILRRYREAGGEHVTDAREVVERIERDRAAALVWQEAIAALATGIVMLTAVLDPAAIVIGGGLSEAGEQLLMPLRRAVAEGLRWRSAPPIEQSLLGPAAALAGAALLVGTAVRPHVEQEI